MSSNTTYNGWTNYATWRVNLEMFDELEPEHFDLARGEELKCTDVSDFADALKDYAEEIIFSGHSPNTPQYCNLIEDYARAFLSDVNWYEIAQHMIDEFSREEA